MASLAQSLRRYAIPLALFAAGLFFQLVVLPSAFPPSHYDVLRVRKYAPISEVTDAYQKLSSRWESGVEVPSTLDFIKIRYAFEFLSYPIWKRDYDGFGIDEQSHVIEKIKQQYGKEKFSKIKLPLLNVTSSDFDDHSFKKITAEDFISNIGKTTTWLLQVYSTGSTHCAEFSDTWKKIALYLDGVVDTGAVELSNVELASFLAERRHTGQAVYRDGVPSLVAFPPNCRSSECYRRYAGDLTIDAVVDWTATSILGLPRILYYSKETLDQNFIIKSGIHKVKFICFSKTGQRALPFMRNVAKEYQSYASFGLVLWQEEDSSFWFNRFMVESAPSIVILKDPGVKPVVHYGNWNRTTFADIVEQNKYQDLPQLRSATSLELGCDARGTSRAGNDTVAWYCVILAGRPSWELNRMRETMRKVQDTLSNCDGADAGNSISLQNLAADALRQKRLTFAWLDGEKQDKLCSFYLHSETSYETCGSRKFGDLGDVPRLFLVRYKRNFTESAVKVENKRMKSMWDRTQEVDINLASQLVARYNGSEATSEIIEWVSQTIEDGDTRNLPYFRAQTPELIPEDSDPTIVQGLQGALSNRIEWKNKLQHIKSNCYDRFTDPRLGPIFLLGACISFGAIYVQQGQESKPNADNELEKKVESKAEKRRARRPASGKDRSSSITDVELKDAYQALSSGSDSE